MFQAVANSFEASKLVPFFGIEVMKETKNLSLQAILLCFLVRTSSCLHLSYGSSGN
jgi:hypothetical protein